MTDNNNQKTAERYVQIIRTEVPAANVDGLLAVREEAIAEAQRLCPSLIGAQLVQLDDGVWLDILTWSEADGEAVLMAQAEHFSAVTEMHGMFSDMHGSEVGRAWHTV